MTDPSPFAANDVSHGFAAQGAGAAVPDLVPKPVVLAIVSQLALAAIDCSSLLFVGFAVLGMMQSTAPPSDPSVDAVMRAMVLGYGLASMLALGLGVAAGVGFYRGAPWARTAAMAHGILGIVSCSPCNWVFATLAIIAALHPDVVAWPSMSPRDVAETFR